MGGTVRGGETALWGLAVLLRPGPFTPQAAPFCSEGCSRPSASPPAAVDRAQSLRQGFCLSGVLPCCQDLEQCLAEGPCSVSVG